MSFRRLAPPPLLLIAVLAAILLALAAGGFGAVALAAELPESAVAISELGEKASLHDEELPSRELPAISFQRRGPPRGAFTVEPIPRTNHWKEIWQRKTDSRRFCSSR